MSNGTENRPLWSDGKSEDDIGDEALLDSDQVIYNLYDDVLCLKEEIEKLKAELATAKADALCKFVSDTTETGQFGWSDCQWLDDWKYEWLEQQAKERGE